MISSVLLTLFLAGCGSIGLFFLFDPKGAEFLVPDRIDRSMVMWLGILGLIKGWDQFLRTWYYIQVYLAKGKVVEYRIYLNGNAERDIEQEFHKINEYCLNYGIRDKVARRLLRDSGVYIPLHNAEIFDAIPLLKKSTVIREIKRSGKPVCIYEVSVYFPTKK